MKPTTPFTSSSSASSSSPVSSSSNPDWAWLPHELLYLVLNKLMLLSDMISFSSVCTNWRSVAKCKFNQLNIRPHMSFNRNLPMLLIPSIDNNDYVRNLHHINQAETYDLRLEVPYNKRCCGSSHGWLIYLNDDSFTVTLINPFYFGNSKGIIHLPQFSPAIDMFKEFGHSLTYEHFIHKAILSCDPISSPNECIVMVIYGDMRMLAYWKPGSESWKFASWCLSRFYDLIYSQGQFVAVNSWGQIFSFAIDVATDHTYNLSVLSTPLFRYLGTSCRRYIVELPDKILLQVIRKVEVCMCNVNGPVFSTRFFIYMVKDGDDSGWTYVESLMDNALFLGDNYSHYVSASQFPGCRPNSIYFTDANHDPGAGPFDIGVYRYDDKTVGRHQHPIPDQSHFPPPIWILPTI